MAKTTKRKGHRSATDRKMADEDALRRRILKARLREEKEITRLSRALVREITKADRALRTLVVFIHERDGDGFDLTEAGKVAIRQPGSFEDVHTGPND